MKQVHLNIPYGNFLNIYHDFHANYHNIEKSFNDFKQEFCKKDKIYKTVIYGGSESGCVCYSLLKTLEQFEVVFIMDRNKPDAPLSAIAHITPDSGQIPVDCDIIFVSTAPKHYEAISKKIRADFKEDVAVCYLYADDLSDKQKFGKSLPLSKVYDEICQSYLKLSDHYSAEKYASLANGEWVDYDNCLLRTLPFSLEGKKVLDYGCGTGVLVPLLKQYKVDEIIGVEPSPEHVANLNLIYGKRYDRVSFKTSEKGYIPLHSNSIDFVVMNEVISHITYSWLDTAFIEVNRVLRPGGALLVSDGNNLDYETYLQETLIPLYEQSELGPYKNEKSYVTLRKEIIRGRHSRLSGKDVTYLAENTFGLYGDYLLKVVDDFVAGKEFIPRPFRRGICPIPPSPGFVLPERAFYPEQVRLHLQSHGFQCTLLHEIQELKSQLNFKLLAIKTVF